MSTLGDKIVALHLALEQAALPHAFGGALALAWCTERPRGTSDIDLNVFVDTSQTDLLLAALPPQIEPTDTQIELIRRDSQARLFWDRTPIDLFLDTTDFHRDAMVRAQTHEFAGHRIPFLACSDLAVFKAFFDRTKDWADLEEMIAAGTLDRARVLGELVTYLGTEDHRVARLLRLATEDDRS